VLVIRQEAPAALGAPTGALGWRLARPREAMVASLLLLLPPLLASQIFVARLGALMTGATRLMTSPSMSWPAPSEEGSLSIPSSSRVHLTMITCSRSLEMFLCPTGGPAFQPSKRRRTGLPPRNPRPALVDTTVPAQAMPRSGIIPPDAARGHRCWVASGQVVLCIRCGFYSTGPAGHLLVDCQPVEFSRISERAVRNRKLFLDRRHPADEGRPNGRSLGCPRPLQASDAETTWLRLRPACGPETVCAQLARSLS